MSQTDSSEVSSLLTTGQREWLRGDDDALKTPPRLIRMRIRERFRQSISDLALLHRSDRIDSEEMMKSIRTSSSTSNQDTDADLSSLGDIEEDAVEEAANLVILLYEAVTGRRFLESGLGDITAPLKNTGMGGVDDEYLPPLAVLGADQALQTADKTEKQSRQWIEHNWPDPGEAIDHLKKSRAWLDGVGE